MKEFYFNKNFKEVRSDATTSGYELKHEGLGKTKFTGASYVVTREKVIVISPTGELLAQYDIEDEFVATPTTLTSAGTPGQKAWDNSFLYYCVAPSVWIKVLPQSADLTIENMFVAVPATLTSAGLQGTFAYDSVAKQFYICVATNTWERFLVTDELSYSDMYVAIPTLPTSAGSQGQRAYDSVNLLMYECVATNTWIRYAVINAW